MQVEVTIDIDPLTFRKQRLLLTYLCDHDPSGLIEGLMCMCDGIADYVADKCDEPRVLMTGSKTEDAMGKRLVAELLKGEAK